MLQHLARRGSAWPEASAAAIRDLQSRMIERQGAMIQISRDTTDDVIPSSYSHNQSHHDIHGAVSEATTYTSRPNLRTGSVADYGIPGMESSHSQPVAEPVSAAENVSSWQQQSEAVDVHRNTQFDHDSMTFSNILQGSQPFDQSFGTGSLDALDPFSGFDIPFWFEQDQHWDIFQDFS